MAAGSEREAELLLELNKLRDSSAREIQYLKDRLEDALEARHTSPWVLCTVQPVVAQSP